MSLSSELKRRNVYKVGAAYVVVAWLLLEVASVLSPILDLPSWVPRAILLVLFIGFPLSLFFAWAFELTPDGIKPTSEVQPEDSIARITGRKFDFIVIGLLSIAVLVLVVDKYIFVDDSETGLTITEPSIAVLPFADMSPDKDQEYLSDGISEELLNLLSQVEGLKVIARTSSFAFKGQNVGIKEIAEKLDVAHVLEGSVRKSEDRLRITAQLILAEDGSHLWSDTWDRDHKDIFAIQDEIAAAVVESMQFELLGKMPTVSAADLDAYTLYLQAQKHLNNHSPESWSKAEELFRSSIEVDSLYAPAWLGLASTYNWLGMWGVRPHREVYALAQEAIDKARELNRDDHRVYSLLAIVALTYQQDLSASANYATRARQLWTLGDMPAGMAATLAAIARCLGRQDDAIRLLAYATEIDPLNGSHHYALGYSYQLSGRFDDALASYRRSDLLAPGMNDLREQTAGWLLAQGKFDDALASIPLEDTGNPYRLSMLAAIYQELGRDEDANAALNQLILEHEGNPIAIAIALANLGEADRALAQLEKARTRLDPGLLLFLGGYNTSDYHWAQALNDAPGWMPFLRKVGMAPEQLAQIKVNTDLSNDSK